MKKLPRIEWDFEGVPKLEIWAYVLWEFGRSSDHLRQLLPNYGSLQEVQARIPELVPSRLTAGAYWLHRILLTLSNFHRDLSRTPEFKAARRRRYPTQAEVFQKNRAIQRIANLPGLGDQRSKILELATQLSVKSAVGLAEAVDRIDFQEADSARRLASVTKRYSRLIPSSAIEFPFPNEPWNKLDQRSRDILCLALVDDKFIGDVQEYSDILHAAEDSSDIPVIPVDLVARGSEPRS